MARLDPPSLVTEEGTPGFTKDARPNEEMVRFRPITIFHAVGCTSMQWRAEDWEARTQRAFLARESALIEQELWTGSIATAAGFPNDFLTNNPTIVGGAALGYVRALGELEQANADVTNSSRPAMIHAEPRLVTLWLQNGLVTPSASGRQLRTGLGTLVVPGAGYDGSGPDHASGGTVAEGYAYITGIVNVRRGTIRTLTNEDSGVRAPAAFDIAINDFVVRVERPFVYWFDPCLKHGVKVNLTQPH